jgi:hypothetical protein
VSVYPTYVTVLSGDSFANKQFGPRDNVPGAEIIKTAGIPQKEWQAQTHPVNGLEDLEIILNKIGNDHCAGLILGYIKGTEDGLPYKLITRKELAKLLKVDDEGEALAGVHTVECQRYAARLKISFHPSSVILFDYDVVKGMPEELHYSTPEEWLKALRKMIPGMDAVGCLVAPSSSSRAMLNGKPVFDKCGFHAYVMVQDADDVERFRGELNAYAICTPYGFLRPILNQANGEVVAQWPWSITDTTVLSCERLVFDGKPKGWVGVDIAPASIQRIDGGRLDTSLTVITDDQLEELKKKTGNQISRHKLKSGKRIIKAICGHNDTALSLATEVDTRNGRMTVKDFWSGKLKKVRCQAVFRPESTSCAAFLRMDKDGMPYLFDSGGNMFFNLGKAEQDELQAEMDARKSLSLMDFYAYAPSHRFIHVPTLDLWPAASVDSRISGPKDSKGKAPKATSWLDQNRSVEQITWAPGLDMVIEDKVIQDGGWINKPGNNCFNLYKPPIIELGSTDRADPWVEHVHKVYPENAEHILNWLAYRVQHPEIKINHGLVLGGNPGIGKDTLLEPIKHSVGPWNFKECSPAMLTRRFNSFLRTVILRVNEARDLGDIDRYSLYDHMKNYLAAPPDVLEIDEKNIRECYIPNLVGVIITTNYKGTGLFLPADDRRHYVAWSPLSENPFAESYWIGLWNWYGNGGDGHVAAFLAQRDVSQFNPKAPPERTEAFWFMVDANRSPEDAELADLLDQMKNPAVVTLAMLRNYAEMSPSTDLVSWLDDRRNRRQIPHRMEEAGYEVFRNQGVKDGLWVVGGKRQSVYVNKSLNMTVSEINSLITAMVRKV